MAAETPPAVHLYTWGNKKHKQKPKPSDFNICVTGISAYKPKGLNLKKINGLNDRLQAKLQRQPKYDMYMASAIQKIQSTKPKIVSINCHKGRHRSVGFAELLAVQLTELGYEVTIEHVDIC